MTLHSRVRSALVGSVALGVIASTALVTSPATTASTTLDPKTLGIMVGFDEPSRFAAYERDLRTPVRWVVAMADHRSPSAMKSSTWGQLVRPQALLPRISGRVNLTLSVPLAFGNVNARSAEGQRTIGANLRATAAGRHDADYRVVARHLIDAGLPDAVIRLGHEFDGDWYPWSARGNNQEYIAAFRHVHDVFASESASFRFEWTPMRASFSPHGPPAYPGDAYVDVVGLDIYYREPAEITDRVWNEQYLRVLQTHLNFARARNKPVAYSEWGTGRYDNPRFLELMHSWFANMPKSGGGRLLYQAYFTPTMPEYDLDRKPVTKRRYLDIFGGSPDRSPAPSPATLPKRGSSAPTPPAPTPPAPTPPAPTPPTTAPPTTPPPGVGAGALPELEVTTGDRTLSAVWSHPAAELFQFRYRSHADERWNWDEPTRRTSRIVEGLTNGTDYVVEVRAYFDGDWRAWTTIRTAPGDTDRRTASIAEGAQMMPTVSAGIDAGVLGVQWSHPTATLYQFRYRSAVDQGWNWDEPSGATSRRVEALPEAPSYEVQVRLYLDGDWREWNTVTLVPG